MTVATLPDYDVHDPAVGSLPLEELRRLQGERLAAMVAYVHAASPFWRRKLDEAGVEPGDVRGVDDVRRLPFVTRAELQDAQAANPPYGSYTCSPRESWVRLFSTSGTSGRPLRRVFSARDWDYALANVTRRADVGTGDLCMVLGPIDGLVGPSAGVEAWQRRGALVCLAGLYDTETRASLIVELRPTVIVGVASYLVHLSEVAAGLGLDLAAAGVRRVQSVGEPGAGVPATKALLMERYGCREIVDGYGMTEIMPIGGSSPASPTLHVASDLVLMECLDPTTDEPVAEGELGELVYTNLVGDTQPLLRYRSRDLARITTEPTEEGFRGPRILGIEGRTDEMIWYRGVNVFPGTIEQVIRAFPGLASEYRIVVDRSGPLPELTVEVEEAAGPVDREALADRMKAALGVRAQLSFLEPGALPRTEGAKVRRVVERGQAPTVAGRGA